MAVSPIRWKSTGRVGLIIRRRVHTSPSLRSDSTPDALIYPEPATSNHRDISSFLRYAERTGLDTKSPTYVGTHYEYTVASSLAKYGFSLRRIGRPADFGIDLLGTWSVPAVAQPLKVIIQCKAIQQPGPHLIRELEGAFVGAPVGWRGSRVLGFLVTEKHATKGIRDSMGRSRWPMGFVSCSRSGHVEQFLWNRRAEEEGLEGLGVGIRRSLRSEEETQLMLTWQGKYQPFAE